MFEAINRTLPSPHHAGPVVHVLDASRGVPVAQTLLDKTRNLGFMEVSATLCMLKFFGGGHVHPYPLPAERAANCVSAKETMSVGGNARSTTSFFSC